MTGIHHVTAITRHVQKNVDFWAGFLGLRLVKRTGGYEDAEQLHLFYGDRLGSPGSIVSFLVWQDGAPGQVGLGQFSEIALAVAPASFGGWIERAMHAGVPATGPVREFGNSVLRLKDPDGITVKLVGSDPPATAPASPDAPRRVHAVTLLTAEPEASAVFLRRFGYRTGPSEGSVRRLISDHDAIDLRGTAGFIVGAGGTGVVDHVAFRAPDAAALQPMRIALKDSGSPTQVHDRQYFLSLYAREPGGALVEYATDGPGFTVDEPQEALGTSLFVPPHDQAQAADLAVMLPQFALPGEPRRPKRDLPFVHRFHDPRDPDGSVLVLLHGSGGKETDLMPLAARIAPRATLLGVRGRATEEGSPRWFRRFDAATYDQADIRAEADAFAAFVDGAVHGYGLSPDWMTFLGYSNGANFLGAVMRLRPGLIRRAVLLRGIEVLEKTPTVDLTGARVLVVSGTDDPLGHLVPRLAAAFGTAALEQHEIRAGHALDPRDIDLTRDWLARQMA